MKLKYSLVILLFFAISSHLCAQEVSKDKPTIFEALLAEEVGSGSISIQQSQSILQLVGKPATALSGARYSNGYAILQGYRVQLYSGNRSNSKNIARARAAQVKQYFPDLDTSVEFEAPFWRLRVGGFVGFGEAREALRELKKQFPTFAKEMYVVRSTIRIKQ